MDKLKIFLISAAGLLLLAFSASAATASFDKTNLSGATVDPALQKLLDSGKDEEIPVIVIAKGQNMPDLGDLKVKYRYRLIKGVAGNARPSMVRTLAASDAIKGVYLDGLTHAAEPARTALSNDTLCPANKINAEPLWSRGIDGRGVTVAILDSGIDKNHPDLAGKVVGEKNFVVDDATSDDLLGHGTLVAGIVAGSGAASGGKYKGVAPGANLLNVKVIDKNGDGKISDIIAGMEWALDNHADILSLSLGGMNLGETNPPVTMAADNAVDAGAVVCVAAGNRNNTKAQGLTGASMLAGAQANSKQIDLGKFDISQNNGAGKEVLLLLVVLALPPGLIDSPGDGVKVITLGASDSNDHIASFSGSGPTRDGRTKPSVVAPGLSVVSTVPPGLENLDYIDIYYAKQSGTSLSTPVAAGMAALLLQADPRLTPAGVKAAMILGAKKLNNSQGEPYEEYYQGAGRLDANRSFSLLNASLSGVMPDAWNAGRWAYLGAGKGLYVGLDTGADRPQKKIYALAPRDDEITNQFVFFTNQERKNISTTVKGPISDWVTLQPLPKNMPANSQKVFGATIAVPNGTKPGEYSGWIEIAEGNKILSSIPVATLIAEPINIEMGRAVREDRLQDAKWHYYYLDVPLGTSELASKLGWRQNADLDLFLLSPTSEYYAGEKRALGEDLDISDPPSGRWLVAVHAKNLTKPLNYTLSFEQSLVETSPKMWNAGAMALGTRAAVQFKIENKGPSLTNITYVGSVENVSKLKFKGSIGSKDLQEKFFEVPEGTARISANMSAEDGNGDIAFLLLDPGDKRVYAAVGSESMGSPDVIRPQPGKWRIWIYGNNVPMGQNESFSVEVTRYLQVEWSWISTKGPSTIESESNATLEASLRIPANASSRIIDGNIEFRSANQSFLIPVSLAVAGTSLKGLDYSNVEDKDKDGFFDELTLGFAINLTVPGNYTVEGSLVDCQGNQLEWLKGISSLQKSGDIIVDIDGKEIWKKGGCGPLKIHSLFLYNEGGDLLDHYNKSITIQRSPKEFQHPAAYFTGNFSNQTTASKIGIGVGIRVVKAGNYELSGRIEDDIGEDMGKDTATAKLEIGNRTMILEFNPTKFIMMAKASQMHLKDLSLKLDGVEIDQIADAWSSPQIDQGFFKGGHNTIKTDRGRVVIP
jgi:subtilisin family serine protease